MNNELTATIQLEINAIKDILKVNNFELINEQKNYIHLSNGFKALSNIEYIFQNDKINIYLKYTNTYFSEESIYNMIVRIIDNTVNMVNLCTCHFNNLQLSKINDFLIQAQVFINSYKKLIGEKK